MICSSSTDIPAHQQREIEKQPAGTAHDLRREFSILLHGCGFAPLTGHAQVKLRGEDRVRWLNGMVTNNVRDLPLNRGVYAFVLNPQGRILGDLYAYHRGDFLTIETDASQFQTLLPLFDHYIIMDDVEVSDCREKLSAITVIGPRCRETLHAAGVEIPQLEPLGIADISWKSARLTVLKTDRPVIESHEIWTAPEDALRLQQVLTDFEVPKIGEDALEALRIAEGVPRYGVDIRERDLPQETGQSRALNFSKGCYVGQEIVERIRSRGNVHRTFTGFAVNGELPERSSKIRSAGKEVGEITSAARLPVKDGEYTAALGYIRREVGGPGTVVEAEGARLTIAGVPFKEVFAIRQIG